MIKIYSTVYIKPNFIELQYEQLKKYCKDDFKFIIINNGVDANTFQEIMNMCEKHNLTYLNVLSKRKNIPEYSSNSHSVALEYTLVNYIKKDTDIVDINVIMDSDIFAYKEFSFIDIMNDNKLAGIYQERYGHTYIAAIFMLFDGNLDLSNFSFHSGIGDTGAAVQTLMKDFNIIPEWINHTAAIDIESEYIFPVKTKYPYMDKYKCQFIADAFIHYYRGSNWDNNDISYHKEKLEFIKYFLNNNKEYNINLDGNVNYPFAHAEKSYNGIDYNYNNYKYNIK